MEKKGPASEKKGFFTKLFEKIDKKLEEKAKKTGCGCASKKDPEGPCCG
ncbi:MAG TPA: hypothetical protein P5561_02600 [Candidatus Omnitrophota bacterium]|jgi:hypothetical protein|nr:hypothetical protein [Candidatus Omnitrophota bacterium]HRY85404.1 hypothetical protein [Candidatus Omnitrophota bacterium]